MHLIWQIFFPLSLLMIPKYVPFVTIVYGRSRKMREQQKSSFRQIIRFSCTHTHRTCRTWSRIRYRVCVFLCREKHNRGVCKKLSSRKYIQKTFKCFFIWYVQGWSLYLEQLRNSRRLKPFESGKNWMSMLSFLYVRLSVFAKPIHHIDFECAWDLRGAFPHAPSSCDFSPFFSHVQAPLKTRGEKWSS